MASIYEFNAGHTIKDGKWVRPPETMDIVECSCSCHRGKVIYRGIREACIQNIKNRIFENDAANINKWTVVTPEGERLNVDDYMVRYAP